MKSLDPDIFYWKLSAIARALRVNEKNLRIALQKAGVILLQRGRRFVLPKTQIPDLIDRIMRAKSPVLTAFSRKRSHN